MENTYLSKAFSDMISAKLVIEAQNILKANGFQDIDMMFSVAIRENTYFKVNVVCNEWIFELPEINLYEDIVTGEIDEGVKKFVNSYGAFLAYEYAKHHGKEIKIDPKYAE